MADAAQKWLVETEWLASHLDTPGLVVLDGSMHLPTAKRNARAEYLAEHIPGALFFDIDDIADEASPLPHMLPSSTKFASRVKKMGIGDGMHVVAYDSEGLYSAARVWWMFRAMGHEQVQVLNGGLKKWKAEGRPLEDGEPRRRSERHFTAMLNADLVRDVGDVKALIGSKAAQIVDARAAARFEGTVPEPRAGPALRPYPKLAQRAVCLAPQSRRHAEAGSRAARDLRQGRRRHGQAGGRLLRLRRHRRRDRAGPGAARPPRRRRLRRLLDRMGRRSRPADRDRPGAVVRIHMEFRHCISWRLGDCAAVPCSRRSTPTGALLDPPRQRCEVISSASNAPASAASGSGASDFARQATKPSGRTSVAPEPDRP